MVKIIVRSTEGSNAAVEVFEDERLIIKCDAFIGRNGLGKTREGDGKTPVGDFRILTCFGIKPNPGTSLPYIRIDGNIWCCGDNECYNKIIDIRDHPHKCSGEHMSDYIPEYNYGMFLDYNKECIPGAGSAIFFHCKGKKDYTGGCIAVDEEKIISILKVANQDTVISIQ